MKHLFAALLAALALPLAAQTDVRVMTFNIRHGSGMDGVTNYDRTAAAIRAAAPDVVALQEVDSVTHRSGGRYVLGELAWRTGMTPTFAAAIPFDGGKYGPGLLSRTAPIGVRRYALPGREEARALLVAEFPDYFVAATHLSLTPADRLASLALIDSVAAAAGKPFVLAGDFNAHPGDDFMKALGQRFTSLTGTKAPTYPAAQPAERLDYIMLYRRADLPYVVSRAGVIADSMASDHRPVVASVRLALPASRLITTQPYLQNPSEHAMTVMWQTAIPTRSWVEYGTDTLHLQRARLLLDGQEDCTRTIHKVRLTGLEPGRRYFYRICSQEILRYQAYSKTFGNTARSAFHTFRTRRPDTDTFTALVFNDLHQHVGTYRALLAQVRDVHPDFVIYNGDCVDDPVSREQATRFISVMSEGVGGDSIPLFFLRGNHEIRNAYSVGLRDHFDFLDGKTYGAFSWGDTRFVMLDCGEDKPDSHPVYYGMNDFGSMRRDEADFLRRELASRDFRRAARRVVVHHIPLYGNDYRNLCDSLWRPIMNKARFDISINAHTHRYAYHPVGTAEGNPYPVVVGGGYDPRGATVMILEKRGRSMRLRVLGTDGSVKLDLPL